MNLYIALFSALALGLRHGFDYDHLAAISDITSTQDRPSSSMKLGFLYALGHGIMVAALGMLLIVFHRSLPAGIDKWAEKLVGLTLILLSAYVIGALFWKRHTHLNITRIAMVVMITRYVWWRIRKFVGSNPEIPQISDWNYSRSSVFFIGMLHGIGAETPSQLVVFLLAAQLGGPVRGLLGLLIFILGLLVMNTLMTGAATGMFLTNLHKPRILNFITGLTAVYSLMMGMIFLLGWTDKLPSLS